MPGRTPKAATTARARSAASATPGVAFSATSGVAAPGSATIIGRPRSPSGPLIRRARRAREEPSASAENMPSPTFSPASSNITITISAPARLPSRRKSPGCARHSSMSKRPRASCVPASISVSVTPRRAPPITERVRPPLSERRMRVALHSAAPSPSHRGGEMMRKVLVATAALIALASPAIAADMRLPRYKAPPPVVAAWSWTGCFLGGAQVGCDYQFAGGFVIGVQGDDAWTNAEGSHDSAREIGVAYHSKVRSLASVTGRVGYAWDRFLGYVRSGGAWERDDYWATTIILGTAYTARE